MRTIAITIDDQFACLSDLWLRDFRDALIEAAEDHVQKNPSSEDITVDIGQMMEQEEL